MKDKTIYRKYFFTETYKAEFSISIKKIPLLAFNLYICCYLSKADQQQIKLFLSTVFFLDIRKLIAELIASKFKRKQEFLSNNSHEYL